MCGYVNTEKKTMLHMFISNKILEKLPMPTGIAKLGREDVANMSWDFSNQNIIYSVRFKGNTRWPHLYTVTAAVACAKKWWIRGTILYEDVVFERASYEKDKSSKKRKKSKTCDNIVNPVPQYSQNVEQEKIQSLVPVLEPKRQTICVDC